jgi:hypothetical protein
MNFATRWCCMWAAIVMAGVSGCTGRLQEDYGVSEGYDARQSPAAISVFRNLCDDQGKNSIDVKSFSPKAKTKLASIVWTPDHFELHAPETYRWLEEWLALGDRTLVYVGRDFSPMTDYWNQVSEQAMKSEKTDEAERLAIQEKIGMAESELDTSRLSIRSMVATPWCIFDHSEPQFTRVTKLNGAWSDGVNLDRTRIFVRGVPIAYKRTSLKKQQAIFDIKEQDTSEKPQKDDEFGFKWQSSDGHMLDIVKGLTKEDLPVMEVLLSSGDGKPLVTQFTRKSWGSSRVILLSNASLISNISLVNEGNLEIAKQLASALPNKNVGYLTGAADPRIRKDDALEQQKGFEMLTMWPLNVITLHAVFLGLLMLLAVFPIFGRARRLPQRSTRDFGQHVDAMGGLLLKSRDRFYAMATIADYFRHVRKEPTSPWANVDQEAQQAPKSPFAS